MIADYSPEELIVIVERHERMLDSRKNAKKPDSEQRRLWNQTYYIKNKDKLTINSQHKYKTNQNTRVERQKYYYYRRANKLSILKERYPAIYEKYVNV